MSFPATTGVETETIDGVDALAGQVAGQLDLQPRDALRAGLQRALVPLVDREHRRRLEEPLDVHHALRLASHHARPAVPGLHLHLHVARQMLDLVRRADHIIGHQLVTLPHQIKNWMFPLRGGEAAIFGVQLVMPGLGEQRRDRHPRRSHHLPERSGLRIERREMPRMRALAEFKAGTIDLVPVASRTDEREGWGTLLPMFRTLTPANDLEWHRQVNVPTIRIDGRMIAGD